MCIDIVRMVSIFILGWPWSALRTPGVQQAYFQQFHPRDMLAIGSEKTGRSTEHVHLQKSWHRRRRSVLIHDFIKMYSNKN